MIIGLILEICLTVAAENDDLIYEILAKHLAPDHFECTCFTRLHWCQHQDVALFLEGSKNFLHCVNLLAVHSEIWIFCPFYSNLDALSLIIQGSILVLNRHQEMSRKIQK